MTLSELRKSLFGDKTMLTEDELRQLMQKHADSMATGKRSTSARAAAMALKVNTTYWFSVFKGKQHPGDKIASAYGLKKVNMYEVVED